MDDKRFPLSLSSIAKRTKKVRALVENHVNIPVKNIKKARLQGMWSETFIVLLKDGTRRVVQFRAERLDISPFLRAREHMGALVPEIELLHDEELQAADFWPVIMTYCPGDAWAASRKERDPAFNVAVMKSLGRALANCFVNDTNTSVVQHQIIVKLDRLLESSVEEVQPFKQTIRDLRDQVHDLEKLPLFLSHMDLNQMNIMVSDDGEVTGIVDWELSPPPQPFGMGLHRIHDLAGQFRDGIYSERAEYQDMEKVFWKEVVGGAPESMQVMINDNLHAVQTAVKVGTLLSILELDYGGLSDSPSLRALPKFLTYRIPALRGNGPPYTI